MAREYFSLPTLKFLFHRVHQADELVQYPRYAHFDAEAMEMMIDAAKQLGDTYLFPFYEATDREEPQLESGEILVHSSVKPYIEAAAEGGWISAAAPLEEGGMQIPAILNACAGFIMAAANNGVTGFTGLTAAATNLLIAFGTEVQKQAWLPNMFAGKWQGTMALTEPQAGSSLSDIVTAASPVEDGSYRIRGQKIYISAGDYTDAENVVHFLLARIDGAPKGTKGISLFIVPKYRKNEQGELVFNDITTAGLYHKMGQKGTPAVHLMLGEQNDCHGYLLGEPHKGLSYMFKMMNEARIGVGLGATGVASAAYHAALAYAQQRPQGRRLNDRNLDRPQDLIIQHPDVKRMLLLQKAVVEGSLSLVMQAAKYADLAQVHEGEEKAKYELLFDLLTPMVKTYPSEMGVVAVSNALQVFGGGGFCKDFPVENYYRDIRIFPIYEGTTGIQSQDLLGRKITMKQGRAVQLLYQEVKKDLEAAKTHESLKPYAEKLEAELQQLQAVTMHLVGFAMQGKIERFLADATLFMEMMSIVTVAWQWLKQGTVAKQILLTENPQGETQAFYEAKLHTMKYFFHYEVPKTLGLAQRLKDQEVLTITEEKSLVL